MKPEEFFGVKPEEEEDENLDLEDEAVEEELPESSPEDVDLVEVTVRGRKLKLSPEDAAAVREFQKEVRDRDGARGGELAQLREQVARLEGRVQSVGRTETSSEPEIGPPDPKLAMSDFAEYHRQYTAYIKAEQARTEAELLHRYEKDVSERELRAREVAANQAWADAFYAEHEEFNKPHMRRLVSVVYQENKATIDAESDPRAQRARLAEFAEEALNELVTTGSEKGVGSRPPKVAGHRPPSKGAKPEEEEKQISLAAKAKLLRQKLREGRAA